MPHAFKPYPEHPIVGFLLKLHADLGGQINANKEKELKLMEQMRHVEAVIKIYAPDFNTAVISPRRRKQGNAWFKRGTMFRHVLNVLREASGVPLTVRAITDAVVTANGIGDVPKKQWLMLEAAVRAGLEDHAGKTVERVGEAVPRKWRLKP